ncbi:MAG: 16S rRNA (cytosine967-C5)-methyltransferase [Gammaproteobacteria bacterium]|jgi:16S rRNA (cytosine967-C5)-methyltransferase
MNSRADAAKTLLHVVKKSCPLDLALTNTFEDVTEQKERSFIQALCYGVMRWYPRLDCIVATLLDKPLKEKDTDIKLLLFLGIYQLDFMRTPEHAAVSATVDACLALNKSWAKNMINAVLRRYQREKLQLDALVSNTASAHYAHPDWLIDQLRDDWPENWSSLLEKNNDAPPMHLRINLRLVSRTDYLRKLETLGMNAEALRLSNCGITLSQAVPVEELPGFFSGYVSVQDLGAQLAVSLLKLSPGLMVLDACAAPGGKTAHMFESEPGLGKLVAIDKDAHRIALLKATQQRLGTKMQIIQADAGDATSWWDGELFDRILLDAPCSATGVIRRHPDIKMLRQDKQMTGLKQSQAQLLSSLWPLLKQGGTMVYATCSLFRQENDIQIEKHLNKHDDAKLLTIEADWGVATSYGRQTLPTLDDTDGFYYAVLEKRHE